MSSWMWPTTADVGMRVFAPSFSALLSEAALGVQSFLMSENAQRQINSHMRSTGEWRVTSPHDPFDKNFLFLAWLDEILYRAEVHDQWLTEVVLNVQEDETGLHAIGQVSWVDAQRVEREIEIKAITTHQLTICEVAVGQTIHSEWDEVPSFDGPGWYADVIFDI